MTIILIILVIIVAFIFFKKKKLSFGKSTKEDENATKKCSECMAEIPLKAKKCQHCGTKQKEKIGLGHLLVIGFIIVTFIIIIFNSGGSTSTPQTQSIDGLETFIISQSYVKLALKSPASAKFPTFEYSASDFGGGKWEVVSYVDSQNSFGALIRTNWIMLLTHTGGYWANSSNWELEELIFDGKVVYP